VKMDVNKGRAAPRPFSRDRFLPAKRHFVEMEPRGIEPLTSALQRRHDASLGLSGVCRIAAKVRISFMTLFSTFQEIHSGCCTVAAQILLLESY
jgi:hypothetical protein